MTTRFYQWAGSLFLLGLSAGLMASTEGWIW